MADDDVVVAKKKRTLLEKYDIPVNHLTYEYVEKCKDGKELERIVKILRSGEEGLYPDLEKRATNRLAEILPSSRVLRVEEPVLTKSMLAVEHWNQVNNDLANWSTEMKTKEQDLDNAGESLVAVDMPCVRSEKTAKTAKPNIKIEDNTKVKSILPRDYSEWDKYDADKEILKIDLEEEKRVEELEIKQRLAEKETLKKPPAFRATLNVGTGDYSNTEKEFLANQEKDKGNDYFKGHEYKLAIEHYSASISINSSPVAYNNRAMAYIKLEQYLEALIDCNKVLELEPTNVKALHRRGIAYKHRGNYQQALDDFLRIMQLEPSNRVASSLAQEVQAKLDSNRRSVRMHITEEDSFEDDAKITEIPDESVYKEPCIQDPSAKVNTSWPAPPDRRVKCNEFGLPKIMCNCCGVPDWVRRPPPRCLICKEIKERRSFVQLKLKEMESSRKDSESVASDSEDSESDEDSVCEHVGKANPAPETVVFPSGTDTASDNFDIDQLCKELLDEKAAELKNDSCADVAKGSKSDEDSVCEHIGKANPAPETVILSGNDPASHHLDLDEICKELLNEKAAELKKDSCADTICKEDTSVQAIRGLSLEDGNTGKISTPFEFINALQSAKGEDSALLLAPVLQRIDPSDLHSLIGNKLDDIMLRSILECLEKCFIDNGPLVLKFLENLATLPRFAIAQMFMDSKTKEVVRGLFENLVKQGVEPSDRLQNKFGFSL